MKTIGNILWLLFTGIWGAICYFLLGIFWCITIVGIPFGLQAFKYAKLFFSPFGKRINTHFAKHPIANLIWLIFGGFESTIGFCVVGILWCVTIVGIPFGLQAFKLAALSLAPFGATVSKG